MERTREKELARTSANAIKNATAAKNKATVALDLIEQVTERPEFELVADVIKQPLITTRTILQEVVENAEAVEEGGTAVVMSVRDVGIHIGTIRKTITMVTNVIATIVKARR